MILYNHRKNNILTQKEVIETYSKVKQYFIQEQDLRGYVPSKGWAHSVAHTADTIDELALCSEIGHDELKDMLDIIKNKISNYNYVFINEEDERLVTAIVSILNRKLIPDEEMSKWLSSLIDYNRKGLYPDDSI